MKKRGLLSIVSAILLGLPAVAQSEVKDSIVIAFDTHTRMVVYGSDRKELAKLSDYDLNRLWKDIALRLDSLPASGGTTQEWVEGKLYLKEGKQHEGKEEGKIIRFNIGGVRFNIGKSYMRVANEDEYCETDTVEVRRPLFRMRRSPRQGVDIKLGLNRYGENKPNGYDASDYDLRTGGSRFVSVGIVRSLPIAKGRKSGLFMDLGLDVSWYNLMFEGNEVIRRETDNIIFQPLVDQRNEEIQLRKNKLVAPYVNLSLMPTVGFAGSVVSHISGGVYGGYRLGGYHKSKSEAGHKERMKSGFFMEEFRTGVALELGIRNFPDLFVNYDLNGLFEEGRGPQVRMLSFGIRL